MEILQIRNATIKVKYANKVFLIDPWLMKKDQLPGHPAAANSHVSQPRVDLPISIEEIVKTDAVILTHYHLDHWDEIAAENLDKNIPFFVQDEEDSQKIQKFGFTNLRIVSDSGTEFEGIKIYKTYTQHGRREVVEDFCKQINMPYDAMGVVLQAENHKTLYIAGDTIWCEEVKQAIDKFSPDVIVINACGAQAVIDGKKERIIMDVEDVKQISSYAKNAKIIASYMDTISHLTVTRDDIKNLKLHNVLVPADNETLKF
ncbi:hypothetical protein M9Y10_006868 [Tritrichomonas musculus]|uniref:Metallo-beta-lactamase domain-containing protein n=1 Tax=Tritrichomonas musculus TaxID=1915356 RepID=A0ABR2JG97_9EUKA